MNSAERPQNTLVRINTPEHWKAQPISPEKKSGRNSWGCLAGLMGILLLLGFGALYLLRHPNLWRTDGQAANPATAVPGQENMLLESSGLTPISGEMPPTWTPQSVQDNYLGNPLRLPRHFPAQAPTHRTPALSPSAVRRPKLPDWKKSILWNTVKSVWPCCLNIPMSIRTKKLKIEGQIISFGEVSTPNGLQFGVQIIPLNDGAEEEQFWTPVLVLNLPPDPLFVLNKPLRIYALGAENMNNIRVQELYWDAPILLAVSYEVLD